VFCTPKPKLFSYLAFSSICLVIVVFHYIIYSIFKFIFLICFFFFIVVIDFISLQRSCYLELFMFFWNESSLCVWKKTGYSPSFMPKLFIALELRVDTGNLSKIEESIKEGFEVK
jgi:hypothetical protein